MKLKDYRTRPGSPDSRQPQPPPDHPSGDWAHDLRARMDEWDLRLQEAENDVRRFREMLRSANALLEAYHLPMGGVMGDLYEEGVRLSARDLLIRLLRDAGKPLAWSEIHRRVSALPDPPTPGALTNAFYHNTTGGTRCFVPLGGKHAGLAGRDEGWEPSEMTDGESNGKKLDPA